MVSARECLRKVDVESLQIEEKKAGQNFLHKKQGFTFTKKERLRKKKEFQLVFGKGNSLVNRYIVIYYLKKDNSEFNYPEGHKQLGLIVSKKCGKAVKRNRIRRLLREVFRLNKHKLKTNISMILIARPPIKELGYHKVEETLLSLWKKAKLI